MLGNGIITIITTTTVGKATANKSKKPRPGSKISSGSTGAGAIANTAPSIPRSPRPADCRRFGLPTSRPDRRRRARPSRDATQPRHHPKKRLQSGARVRSAAARQTRRHVRALRLLPRGGRRGGRGFRAGGRAPRAARRMARRCATRLRQPAAAISRQPRIAAGHPAIPPAVRVVRRPAQGLRNGFGQSSATKISRRWNYTVTTSPPSSAC